MIFVTFIRQKGFQMSIPCISSLAQIKLRFKFFAHFLISEILGGLEGPVSSLTSVESLGSCLLLNF
jgi:hypothetical protein